jgi:hypothetical protein
MDLPQLTDDQVFEVREFFSGAAASLIFQRLEAEVLSDWIMSQSTADREQHWHKLQAILELQAKLRDAGADKRLTQRSQNARATNAVKSRTEPVDTPST